MDYETFTLEILREVKSQIGGMAEIRLHRVVKNNGVLLTGLLIRKQGGKTAPSIYLEDFYQSFLSGASLLEIVSQILSVYQERKEGHFPNMDFFADFERVKGRVLFKVVNRDMNESRLVDIPYLPFLDFAITFYYLTEGPPWGRGSVQITNSHMGMWNTDKDGLYHCARENTMKLRPPVIFTMQELMDDCGFKTGLEDNCPLHVLTNGDKTFGAAGILFDQTLQRAGEILGTDYYVLPSSIHEVLLISDRLKLSRGELNEIVQDINQKQVPREEVLADHVYHYDRKNHRFLGC